jgi:hypothetical protein
VRKQHINRWKEGVNAEDRLERCGKQRRMRKEVENKW